MGINRVPFETSGHRNRPEGLVIENYLRHATLLNNVIKSVVHPPATKRCEGVHHFTYREGRLAVDEIQRPARPGAVGRASQAERRRLHAVVLG